MSNVEKLLKNIQTFIEFGGEKHLLQCCKWARENGETIETIDDLNDLLEEEMSNWDE